MLDIVDGTVNVTKCIGILLECVVIDLFHCLKDGSKPSHRAKLVTNWKCQNKTRTLTLPTQSQDMSPIENLW